MKLEDFVDLAKNGQIAGLNENANQYFCGERKRKPVRYARDYYEKYGCVLARGNVLNATNEVTKALNKKNKVLETINKAAVFNKNRSGK